MEQSANAPGVEEIVQRAMVHIFNVLTPQVVEDIVGRVQRTGEKFVSASMPQVVDESLELEPFSKRIAESSSGCGPAPVRREGGGCWLSKWCVLQRAARAKKALSGCTLGTWFVVN